MDRKPSNRTNIIAFDDALTNLGFKEIRWTREKLMTYRRKGWTRRECLERLIAVESRRSA